MKTCLPSKTEVNNVLDLGDRNRENDEKLQTFDSSYFLGKSRLEGDRTKDYLLFPPGCNYFKTPASGNRIIAQKSKGFS